MEADSKTYCPAPSKPQNFDAAIKAMCGANLSGQPRIRVEWGWDLRTFRNGNPKALKYPNYKLLNRWLIEQWVGPDFFGSKKQWEANRYAYDDAGQKVDLIGEYPYRGEYILVIPLLAPDGGYAPCSDDVLKFINIMRRDFESRVDNAFSGVKLHAKTQEKMAQDQAELEAESAKEIDDFKSWWRTNKEKLDTNVLVGLPSQSVKLWTPN